MNEALTQRQRTVFSPKKQDSMLVAIALVCFFVMLTLRIVFELRLEQTGNSIHNTRANLAAICLLTVFIVMQLSAFRTKWVVWEALAVCGLSVIAAIVSLICSNGRYDHPEWLYIGSLIINIPALFTLFIFALTYMIASKNTISIWNGLLIIAVCGLLPCILAIKMHSLPRIGLLILTFAACAFLVKKDRRLSIPNWLFWTIAGVCVMALVYFITHNTRYAAGFEIVLSHGASDPTGEGYCLVTVRELMREVKLLGTSPAVAELPYFLIGDPAYAGASVALFFGWLALAALIIATVVLSVVLFRMAVTATNDYIRYFLFCCATHFILRLIFNLLSEFFLPCAEDYLVFMGGINAYAVDVFLFISALAMYMRRDKEVDILIGGRARQ